MVLMMPEWAVGRERVGPEGRWSKSLGRGGKKGREIGREGGKERKRQYVGYGMEKEVQTP